MKKVLLLVLSMFLFCGVASAEIREVKNGGRTFLGSINRIPLNEDFYVDVIFEPRLSKRDIIVGGESQSVLMHTFAIIIECSKISEKVLFRDPYTKIIYKTEKMQKPENAPLHSFFLSSSSGGRYNTGRLEVVDESGKFIIRQETDYSSGYGANINLYFDSWPLGENHFYVNSLFEKNKKARWVTLERLFLAKARIIDAIINDERIQFTFPYHNSDPNFLMSSSLNKKQRLAIQEEQEKELKYLIIDIPREVVAEWQEAANFTGDELDYYFSSINPENKKAKGYQAIKLSDLLGE